MTAKRSHETMMSEEPFVSCSEKSVIGQFDYFRRELDTHHDVRERVVKSSRDVTAASKKIIFALQRVQDLGQPIQPAIGQTIESLLRIVKEKLNLVAPELQLLGKHRYSVNITGGLQELLEAVLFEHYLQTQQLLSYQAAASILRRLTDDDAKIDLAPEDYVLGLFDMTGELMRFTITQIATSGSLPSSCRPFVNAHVKGQRTVARNVLDDLRELCFRLEIIEARVDMGNLSKDFKSKLAVTRVSVEKVEKALYGIKVRGSERPSGWMPLMTEGRSREKAEELESLRDANV